MVTDNQDSVQDAEQFYFQFRHANYCNRLMNKMMVERRGGWVHVDWVYCEKVMCNWKFYHPNYIFYNTA